MAKNSKPTPAAKATVTKLIQETKEVAEQAKSATAVAYVNPKALALDVGEKAVMAWKNSKDVEAQIADLTDENTKKKGAALKMLTLAFAKAASIDKNIRLEDIYLEKSEKLRDLRQRCEVVVGIKVAKRGEDGVERYEMAPWTKDVLPQPKEDKNQPGFQAKENFRSNFAAAMTKCIKAADALVLKNITAEEDKVTGALMLTGKAVKEHFNVDKVSLNEKREVVDNGKEVKLAKIPSFTELARIGAEARNKSIPTRAQSAKEINPLNEKDVTSAVQSLTMALGKLKSFGDELATAIESLAEACDEALQRNGNEDDEAA
jgi:hypothetical protein